MPAQQPFCFSVKGILEHDSHNQCAKHCNHRLQPGICGPKLFSPASKRNTNKQHKQQNNDDNVGSAVAFTSFDFGPYLSKRTGSDIPDVSGRTLLVHVSYTHLLSNLAHFLRAAVFQEKILSRRKGIRLSYMVIYTRSMNIKLL